jgi:hypothetical protein
MEEETDLKRKIITLSYPVSCNSLPPPTISCIIDDPVTDANPFYSHIRKSSHMRGTGNLGAHWRQPVLSLKYCRGGLLHRFLQPRELPGMLWRRLSCLVCRIALYSGKNKLTTGALLCL